MFDEGHFVLDISRRWRLRTLSRFFGIMNTCLPPFVRLAPHLARRPGQSEFSLVSLIGRRGSFPSVSASFTPHQRLFCEKVFSEEEADFVQKEKVYPEAGGIMKILNVAEKNDAAKNIAKIMNGNQIPQTRRGEAWYRKSSATSSSWYHYFRYCVTIIF